jgi:septin family protein
MAKSQTDRLTSLHETAADRQERYIDAIKSYSGITKIFTNNYLLAPILYALVLCLSLVSSVWSKAETTKFGKEAHSLADAGKEQLEEAKSTWKEEQEELKKHFEKLMQDAEDKAHAIQGSLDKKLAAQGQELKEALAKVKQLEKEKAGGNSVSGMYLSKFYKPDNRRQDRREVSSSTKRAGS